MGILVKNQQKKTLVIVSFLAWLIVGCNSNKSVQCGNMIAIANGVTNQAKKITNSSEGTIVELKNWLQTADIMTIAAQEIEALPIKDPQLIDYQGNLASLFRIYSQATYDAVKARENKNLSALKIARQNAQQADELNQDLVTKINGYCLAE